MTRAPPGIAELATDIVARELEPRSTSEELVASIPELFERLGQRLSTVVGPVGFRAVLTRAAHLTEPGCPWVADLEIGRIGSKLAIAGLEQAARAHPPEIIRAGATALLENLLALLGRFIGEQLTVRLLRREWPETADGGGSGTETETP